MPHTFSALRSLTTWTDVAVASAVGAGAVTLGLRARVLESAVTLLALLLLCIVSVVAVVISRAQVLRLTSSVPFELHGFAEVFHFPAHSLQNPLDTPGSQQMTIWVRFSGRCPAADDFSTAVTQATQGTVKKLSVEGGRLVRIDVAGGTNVDGHRRWFIRFLRGLLPFLCTTHTTYPIAEVTIVSN